MNKKQLVLILLWIISLVCIFVFSPRYKIVRVGNGDFISTEQTSPLYERSSGEEKLHWNQLAFRAGIATFACGILALLLKTRSEKK